MNAQSQPLPSLPFGYTSMEPITACGKCWDELQGPLAEGDAWFTAHRNQEHPEVVTGRRHLQVVREREEER